MASICTRCTLRLHRAVNETTRISTRAFSQTSTRAAVPTFNPTEDEKVDNLLSHMRTAHFLPAVLSPRDFKTITRPQNKTYLEDNPLSVDVGGEEVEFKYFDRSDRTGRVHLLHEIYDAMAQSEGGKGWNELPALLSGLKGMSRSPRASQMAKAVRLAVGSGASGVILRCLAQSRATGMTLKDEEVLREFVWNLRGSVEKGGWEQEALETAMGQLKILSGLLERAEHGGQSKKSVSEDARTRPEFMGVFLEMAAVHAWKFQGKQDVDGTVKSYAQRVLSAVEATQYKPADIPQPEGPQSELLYGTSLWHGLNLASKILGPNMPEAKSATTMIQDFEARLTKLANSIKSELNPEAGSYAANFLESWEACRQD